MNAIADRITLDTMIPDLLRQWPQARPALDRYGLQGCGGEAGPMETLGFFARAHDVPPDRLLDEVRSAAEADVSAKAAAMPALAVDSIFRPFFKAGIAVVLTMGSVWGAFLLIRIALNGRFTAVGIHEVNAHGHAQIFGWVGLFVMGFAYQAFPRFRHTRLAWPRVAFATLGMMLAGIMLRSVCEPFVTASRGWAIPALVGNVLEIAAIGLFVANILTTLRRAIGRLSVYEYFIISALGFFFIQAVYGTLYFASTAAAPTRDALLVLVATWQAPLRDIQIHGFALMMILGVSLRFFHHMYGLPKPSARRAWWALGALNLGIAAEVVGFILMVRLGYHWAALWYGGVFLIFAAVAALMLDWKIWRPTDESDRSLKFLRAAYVWLQVSLLMLLLLPVYQFVLLPRFAPGSEAAHIGFSHAFYGATRHAITVGFISLMIIGVASKVAPTLRGVDVRGLGGLWPTFALINAGCALRVTGQVLTDFTSSAFPFTGVSGVLEVTGLAIWGVHLWRVMGRETENKTALAPEAIQAGGGAQVAESTGVPAPGEPIAGYHFVGATLSARPELLDTFVSFGFAPLANPALRATLARRVPISKACRFLNVDEEALLKALNKA